MILNEKSKLISPFFCNKKYARVKIKKRRPKKGGAVSDKTLCYNV